MGLAGAVVASSSKCVVVARTMFDAVNPSIAPEAWGQSRVLSPGVRYGRNVMPWHPSGCCMASFVTSS